MSHTFATLDRAPAYQKVYEAMQADILSGRLGKGDALPTEGDLAAQFGVHRSTVREGIRQLEQAGLVKRGAAKRMYVLRPQADETAEKARLGLMMHGVSFLEAWEALLAFQPEAMRMATTRLSASDLDALRSAANSLADETNADRTVDIAGAFFQTIAASLDNKVMLVVLQSLNLLVMSSLARVIAQLPNAGRRIGEAQLIIIDACRAGDSDKAARWMRRHIDDLKRGYDVAELDLSSQIN
jgi:GntR family transcriptional regulator, transcriptional repressor for pyruvate dehydrogenase complex